MQVTSFCSQGVSSVYVSGEVVDSAILGGVCDGRYQLIFFTPEMIINKKRWRRLFGGDIYAKRLKAFIVDEAHCVKKW